MTEEEEAEINALEAEGKLPEVSEEEKSAIKDEFIAYLEEQANAQQSETVGTNDLFDLSDDDTFYQSMYKSNMADFSEFYDDIIKNENTKDRYFTEDINGIGLDIPRNTIIHDVNKHGLTKEEWQGIFNAMKNNSIKDAKIGDYSRMNGTPVKMVVDVNGVEYGIAFDHMKNGRNLVESAFILEDKGWINEKQKKSSQMEAYKPLPNSRSLGNSMYDIISTLDNDVNNTFYQLDFVNDKINQIDSERLAYERKDINPELLARENEIVKAVDINRFFADRKASKDISIDDVIKAVDETTGKNENGLSVLKNGVSGETVTLSNRAIEKMFNTTSDRSDSQNIGGILGKEAIANIGKIFDTAVLVKTRPDARHGSKNKISRYANVINSDGENFIVKMTVKEMANKRPELTDIEIEGNGGRDLVAYDLKVGKKNTAEGNISTDKSVAGLNGNDISIGDMIDFVNSYSEESIHIDGVKRAVRNSTGKRIAKTEEGLRAFYEWFGDSKVVDEQGRPLVVYHGTSAEFTAFAREKLGRNQNRVGFFFGESENFVKHFGIKSMPVYLRLNNPKIYKKGVSSYKELELEQKLIDNAKDDDNKYLAYRILENTRKYTDSYDNFIMDMYHKNNLIPYQNRMHGNFYDALPLNNRQSIEIPDNYREELQKENYDGIIIKDTIVDAGSNNDIPNTQYIVFSPNQIKSVDNRGSFSKESDNIYYQGQIADKTLQQAKGSYTPKTRIIHLFKTADHSTIIHEMGHLFTMDYVKLLERQNATEELQGFYNWLGINNINEATTETWEKMARGFETYVMEGVAPNVSTESIFTRFKNFLIGVYQDLSGKVIKPEEINDDVREFFDKMIAGEEEIQDISNLQGKIEDVRKVIKGALRGEEMSVDGFSIKDLRDLVKLLTRRKPRNLCFGIT